MCGRGYLPTVVAVLAVSIVSTDCLAQFGGGMGGGRSGHRDRGGYQDRRDSRPAQEQPQSYEQMEYRLSLLEEDLHLQPAQRASWDVFAEKVRAYAGDLVRARTRARSPQMGGSGTGSGIKHIERAADTARNRATALDDVAAAAKSLYAILTSEQQILADARIATIVEPLPRGVPGTESVPNPREPRPTSSPQY